MSPIRTRDSTLHSDSCLSSATSSSASGRGRRARFWGLLPAASELVTVNLNASACIEHTAQMARGQMAPSDKFLSQQF